MLDARITPPGGEGPRTDHAPNLDVVNGALALNGPDTVDPGVPLRFPEGGPEEALDTDARRTGTP